VIFDFNIAGVAKEKTLWVGLRRHEKIF